MMIRFFLNIVDPSLKYDQVSGIGANLKYPTEEDLSGDQPKLRRVSESEIKAESIRYT